MLAGGWGAVVGSLKGKRQLWGIAGECEERSLSPVGAVMGIGVGSEVGERESRAKTEGVTEERAVRTVERWGRWGFFGKTCHGDGD